MPNNTLRLILAIGAVCLLALSGCAVDPMERLSEDIDSQEVATREQAVLALANLDDERAIEALVEVLESDEVVFDMAGVALVKQGRENVTDKKPDPVLSMVAGVMKNVHLPVPNRARAAWVLGEIGDREAVPDLRAGAGALLANAAAAVEVRTQATLALKKLGDSSDGAPFEIAMGSLEGAEAASLPAVAIVAEIVEEEEDEEELVAPTDATDAGEVEAAEGAETEGEEAEADAAADAGKAKEAAADADKAKEAPADAGKPTATDDAGKAKEDAGGAAKAKEATGAKADKKPEKTN